MSSTHTTRCIVHRPLVGSMAVMEDTFTAIMDHMNDAKDGIMDDLDHGERATSASLRAMALTMDVAKLMIEFAENIDTSILVAEKVVGSPDENAKKAYDTEMASILKSVESLEIAIQCFKADVESVKAEINSTNLVICDW